MRARAALLSAALLVGGPLAAAAIAALVGGVPATALAQDALESRARELFERAVERLRSSQFAEARDLLNQSIAIAPNPGTAFNLAVAYRGTGEALRAESTLEALLREEHGRVAPAQRREVEALLRAIRAEIATLVVEATGAPEIEIRIDGRLAGTAGDGVPLEARVDPGESIVVASATDRETTERRVRADRGARVELAIALRPTPEARVGTLVLEAAHPSHDVEIVGVARGTGRLERVLPPGEYTVRVRAGGSSRESIVTITPRSTTRMRLEDPRGTSVFEEPAFWAVGGGVLIGIAVAVGVALAIGPPREAPVQDPEFGVTIALTGP